MDFFKKYSEFGLSTHLCGPLCLHFEPREACLGLKKPVSSSFVLHTRGRERANAALVVSGKNRGRDKVKGS